MKKMRPSECTRSSQPSGNGPRLSSVELSPRRVAPWCRLGCVAEGMGLARPVRGSTQEVLRSLWSMKNQRPFGAICIVQPAGRPSERFAKLFALVVETVESRRDESFGVPELSVESSCWAEVNLVIRLWD